MIVDIDVDIVVINFKYLFNLFVDGFDPLIVNPDCQCRIFITYIRAKIPLIHAYEMQNEDEGMLNIVFYKLIF